MKDRDEKFHALVDFITNKIGARTKDGSPISERTEIYYDLEIYGDDFYDLVQFLNKKFHVTTNVNFLEYGPKERTFPILWNLFSKSFGTSTENFKKLSIGNLLDIIERKSWTDTGS